MVYPRHWPQWHLRLFSVLSTISAVPAVFRGLPWPAFSAGFLSKSIAENRGFFWAWSIHFVLDVIIFYAKYLQGGTH
jgi:hypothetical protein